MPVVVNELEVVPAQEPRADPAPAPQATPAPQPDPVQAVRRAAARERRLHAD